MKQSIVHVALVVRDYDEAIEFFTGKLDFELVEDIYQPEQDKRWVVVSPPGSNGVTLLLARASKPEQEPFVGNQTGGRVFLFLNTDDFWRDYETMKARGIKFVREPKQQDYGSNNISSSGELGIAVRLQDKVSRMRHILLKELTAQEKSAHVFKANHESLEDTYKDAANYALIGLLLQRKRWK